MKNESSKQRDEDHHTLNQSTTILDEHKNLRNNLYYKLINGIEFPEGMLHQATHDSFRLKFGTP
jgi:hypothetical protein